MADYKRELEELISTESKEGASDLHFSVGHCPTIRVSSELVPLTKYEKLAPEATMGFVIELLSDESQKRFLARKEIDFSYSPGANPLPRQRLFSKRSSGHCYARHPAEHTYTYRAQSPGGALGV